MSSTFQPAASSARVAQALAQLGAVRLTTGQPFIYTSGWASPVYVDTRLLMSDVPLRTLAMNHAAARLAGTVAQRGVNAIIGAESSGIAFAAWIAERLHLPLLYLRKKPMGWGQEARLEGRLPPEARLLLVDDVTTDGRSKIAAARTLREAGTAIADVLVVVDYGIYPDSAARWAEHALALHALTTWRDLLAALREAGELSPEAGAMLEAFTADPVSWSLAHSGVGA